MCVHIGLIYYNELGSSETRSGNGVDGTAMAFSMTIPMKLEFEEKTVNTEGGQAGETASLL